MSGTATAESTRASQAAESRARQAAAGEELYFVPSSRTYVRVKRVADVALSLIALVVTLPLWLFIAVLVKLNSPGPVLFRQKRPGRFEVPFEILKFRTMVNDAEERLHEVVDVNDTEDPLIRVEDDPRVTGVGHLLRVTSLDELPQLINVLRGEMSIVGPRPISRPIHDPRNRLRLQVTPGITGLWQVSGRKNTDTDYMLRKDMEYLQRRSLSFDLAILLKTMAAVIRADGAR